MPAAEIIFAREPTAIPDSLTSGWIRDVSATTESAPESELQSHLASGVTTNKALSHRIIRGLLSEASTCTFKASNIIAGLSLIAVVGISERGHELITPTKVGVGKVRSLTFASANNTDLEWNIGPIESFLASTTNEAEDDATSARSRLIARIIAERSVADIEAENVALANVATEEAIAFIQGTKLGVMPRVMFSEDGILALQWQRGQYGVALVFAGNGVASISFRRPGQFYAENGIEVGISDGLPNEFADALIKVLG